MTKHTLLLSLTVLAGTCTGSFAAPLGTAFTYQGRLEQEGHPANGVYEMQFALFDDLVAGNPVGTPAVFPEVFATNGLFTVTLDFGQAAFLGQARWLEIRLRTNGSPNPHILLAPRTQVLPAPNSLFATVAGIAGSVSNSAISTAQLAANAVNTTTLQNSAVTAPKIAAGQVVKSLNGLHDAVNLQAGSNVVLTASGNTVVVSASGPGARLDLFAAVAGGYSNRAEGAFAVVAGGERNQAHAQWGTVGGGVNNTASGVASTVGGGNFNVACGGDSTVAGGFFNQANALRATVAGGEQNVIQPDAAHGGIAGGTGNVIEAGAVRALIGGGELNRIGTNAAHSTIAGGNQNVVGTNAIRSFIGGGEVNRISPNAAFATVPGGVANEAGGFASLAAGRRAKAMHDGSFVWADAVDVDFASLAPNQFLIRASGGVGIGTNDPAGAALRVVGTVQADGFNGPVSASQLTGTLAASNLTANPPMEGQVLAYDGNAMVWKEAAAVSGAWALTGNDALPDQFLGTTGNQPLEMRVNNDRVLRLEPVAANGPNIVGGWHRNVVTPGVVGAVIAGGGGVSVSSGLMWTNRVTDAHAVVAGGLGNVAGNDNADLGDNRYAVVGGGSFNLAGGSAATISGGFNNTNQALGGSIGGGGQNLAGTTYSTIAGGLLNQALGARSVIGGGELNRAIATGSSVSGGWDNQALAEADTVSGGYHNVAQGSSSVVGGGFQNSAGAPGAGAVTVAGGTHNNAIGAAAAIGGGAVNFASGGYSIIGGGVNNTNQGDYAAIAGGFLNSCRNVAAFIGGGIGNLSKGSHSTLAGGNFNIAAGDVSFVGGGQNNEALGSYSAIGGGYANLASGLFSSISGGSANQAAATGSSVGGGWDNRALAEADTVSGGYHNVAQGSSSVVGGGFQNSAGAPGASAVTVAGGARNNATGAGAAIGGGVINFATGAYSAVGGGVNNTNHGDYAAIAGGTNNFVAQGALGATVSGGERNQVTALWGTVGGGVNNTAGIAATVGGGNFNSATGGDATIAGGIFNEASGGRAAVGGGDDNLASGDHATVPGGLQNEAVAARSFAAGHKARAQHVGAFVWSSYDAPAPSFGDHRFHVFGTNGLSVDFGEQRSDGGGQKWVHIGPPFAGQAIGTSSGAFLTDSGIWQNASDRNRKTGFMPAEPAAILEALTRLPIQSWRYTNESAKVRHLGPTAQDFQNAFGLGTDEKSIGTVDADGVALAAIQGLNRKLEEQLQARDAHIAALQRQVATLEARAAAEIKSQSAWETRLTAMESVLAGRAGNPTALPAGTNRETSATTNLSCLDSTFRCP